MVLIFSFSPVFQRTPRRFTLGPHSTIEYSTRNDYCYGTSQFGQAQDCGYENESAQSVVRRFTRRGAGKSGGAVRKRYVFSRPNHHHEHQRFWKLWSSHTISSRCLRQPAPGAPSAVGLFGG